MRNDLNMNTLESLCLKFQKLRCGLFVVVRWYRPVDSPVGIFSFFENLIGKLNFENVEYCLMGDLNCDMIASHYDESTYKLMSVTDMYGLQQLGINLLVVYRESVNLIGYITRRLSADSLQL